MRERVLAGRPDGWRLGHALLVGRGVAAWIVACTALVPAATVTQPTHHPAAAATSTRLDGRAGTEQLVAVLAEMALAHT